MQRRSLDFHIKQNDHFGTLATALDLLGQNLRKEGHIRIAEMLGRLRDDLMYLQRSYRIEEVLPSKCSGSVVAKKTSGLQSYNSELISIELETAVKNRRLHRKAALTNDPQSIYFCARRRSKGLVQIILANPK